MTMEFKDKIYLILIITTVVYVVGAELRPSTITRTEFVGRCVESGRSAGDCKAMYYYKRETSQLEKVGRP